MNPTFQLINCSSSILGLLCLAKQKWGMYISLSSGELPEIENAAPYLKEHLPMLLVSGGEAYLFFDSEEDMNLCYHQTIGDDGPTETNSYDGPARVYALTCGPNGKLINENT